MSIFHLVTGSPNTQTEQVCIKNIPNLKMKSVFEFLIQKNTVEKASENKLMMIDEVLLFQSIEYVLKWFMRGNSNCDVSYYKKPE